jgi:hypothetical protein
VPSPARLAVGLAGVVLVLAGCGQPSARVEQEEALRAVAAEGMLLARDAAHGSSTGLFTRVHAEELREQAEALALAPDSAGVARELGRLAAAPRSRAVAAEAAEALEAAAR